jgi:hypothetical protein
MTAVVLYSSIPGVGHHGAVRLELEASSRQSFVGSGLLCLAGDPNRDHGRTPRLHLWRSSSVRAWSIWSYAYVTMAAVVVVSPLRASDS